MLPRSQQWIMLVSWLLDIQPYSFISYQLEYGNLEWQNASYKPTMDYASELTVRLSTLLATYHLNNYHAYEIYAASLRKSYNKYIIAFLRVGQYGEIFSSRVLYCPSLRSGQYCHPRTEYFPILPSQSCNNIYISFCQVLVWRWTLCLG